MIRVEEALTSVLRQAKPTATERAPLQQALGRVLAEDIASDMDSPPHDKAMVDGYAVCSSDLQAGSVELKVLEEVTAGLTPSLKVTPGTATRIMTGAPLPQGADAVVMVERTRSDDPRRVQVDDPALRPGQNIMPRATSMARGEFVLKSGHRLRGIEIGLLAEVGRCEVLVHRQPRVAILATGNELTPAGQPVGAGMIRNSNGPMLSARVAEVRGEPVDLGIGRDDSADLGRLIRQGLECDVLLISGGVSAGVLDLVPRILAEAGVEQVFHKVNLRPGKPLWFGTFPRPSHPTLVFGLPGNPVSSLVCFELFVRPALRRMQGEAEPPEGEATTVARLSRDHQQRGDRVTYFPAWLGGIANDPEVKLLAWQGSADLKTLASANALACFPAGDRHYRTGEKVTVRRLA